MSTTAPELFTALGSGWADAARQWLDQSQRMWEQLAVPPGSSREADPGHHRHEHCDHGRHGHEHHHHENSCRDHEHHHHEHHHHESCCRDVCDCCIPEGDVIVHARVGERRIVPFRLHNSWRREREVTLAVGPWHLCSGDGLVVVAVLEEESLVLKPCEDRIVRLGLAVMAGADEDSGGTNEPNGGGRTEVTHRFSRDLDSCASAYADVRFEGCSRPQRVAVVVRPADCDAIDVACDCGCC